MADEREKLHSAAAALDNRLSEEPKTSNGTGGHEIEGLPEDMTAVHDTRDLSASRIAT